MSSPLNSLWNSSWWLWSGMLVGLGSALGGMLRFALTRSPLFSWSHFPYATMVVNGLGCLLAGALLGRYGALWSARSGAWLFLAVGVLGGFTTFSSFFLDAVQLWRGGSALSAAFYVGLSTAGGLMLGLLGFVLFQRLD